MKNKNKLLRILICIILLVFSFLFKNFNREILFLSYIIISYDIFYKCYEKILKNKFLDENCLMLIATIGAFVIKEYFEGVMVMLLFQIGEYINDASILYSKDKINNLVKNKKIYVTLKKENKEYKVRPELIKKGDIFYVKPGEKVYIDGIIIDGNSTVNTSFITGEAKDTKVSVNDEIISGSINNDGILAIKATKTYKESTLYKIINYIDLKNKEAKTEKFITKFSKIYTPIVVVLALIIFIVPTIFFGNYQEWLYRALIFLVISCPCALVISIPLGFYTGLGVASKNNILIKNSNILEVISKVNTFIFDKTGTITDGKFKVRKIVPNAKNKDEVLMYAAFVEYNSNHPIAKAIVKAYNKEIGKLDIKDYKETSGRGVYAVVNNKKIFAGNNKFMDENNIKVINVKQNGTIVHVAVDNDYYGYILISDQIKEDAKQVIEYLDDNKIVLLSGDNSDIVKKVANELKIENYYGDLLPLDKIKYVKEFKKNDSVMFIGDGINDAPALLEANVGVSFGGIGSDIAIEASDVILTNNNIYNLIKLKNISKKTVKIVWQNIIFAITMKLLILLLGLFGISSLWFAIFADVGVTILVILNSLRIYKGSY